MRPGALARNFLRRRDDRHRVNLTAILECRGIAQNVRVVDFSVSGLRVDGIQGLATADPIQISLTPDISLTGEIAWSVWHKAGIKLLPELDETHPAYLFLTEQASAIEQLRIRALASLAKDRASALRRSGQGSA
ncbi:MAG: PilZ domain-containing protein [Hyphomicrobium sp.]|nr:PilZ domain-containing protein [Hyphomicrobium sp.]MBN9247938.1 PilZ domain-containing protein [Hyphomicrobium sp.]RUP09837.1 MAG: PilZ domain-containing protein [Hyphomicrobium sp.]